MKTLSHLVQAIHRRRGVTAVYDAERAADSLAPRIPPTSCRLCAYERSGIRRQHVLFPPLLLLLLHRGLMMHST